MHLVRLMRMGLEVLETGVLRVRREDAEDLNAIRGGRMSYEELMDAQGVAATEARSGAAQRATR